MMSSRRTMPQILLLLIFWTMSDIQGQFSQGRLSQTELKVNCPNAIIGHIKTIQCMSMNGSLPITYTLFLNKTIIEKRTVTKERRAAFNVTIYNETRLGSYKCKAKNSLTDASYSQGFIFTLQVKPGKPYVTINSFTTAYGKEEIIQCNSPLGSPPITYTLLHGDEVISSTTEWEKPNATFIITIYNVTSLGPYTCSTNHSDGNILHSDPFSFVLAEHLSPLLLLCLRLLIFVDLVLLTLTLQLTVYFCRNCLPRAMP
ncbi:allergin-1-like [Leptodactylus fuscus]|uniref:allergin-1-like n=1 Tax=Leptodactylus fuscus TaxID=238119 RepID=UPI003F4F345D